MMILAPLIVLISYLKHASPLNDCNAIFVRWSRVRLNLTPKSTNPQNLVDCSKTCANSENCAGFNHKQGANQLSHDCQIFPIDQKFNVDDHVEADDRYAYYWKYCADKLNFNEAAKKNCKSTYQFDFHIDRFMDLNEIERTIRTDRVEDCLNRCADEPAFVCRSVSFNRTGRLCSLSAQSQVTKPNSLRVNNNPNYRIDYYEHGCANENELTGTDSMIFPENEAYSSYLGTFTFHHDCRDNGIVVSVDSKFAYSGALYALYDFFTCRVEPKDETNFSLFFPFPSYSKNCSDSFSQKDNSNVLDVVLSTDGMEPLYFLTDQDTLYQAKCPLTSRPDKSLSTIHKSDTWTPRDLSFGESTSNRPSDSTHSAEGTSTFAPEVTSNSTFTSSFGTSLPTATEVSTSHTLRHEIKWTFQPDTFSEDFSDSPSTHKAAFASTSTTLVALPILDISPVIEKIPTSTAIPTAKTTKAVASSTRIHASASTPFYSSSQFAAVTSPNGVTENSHADSRIPQLQLLSSTTSILVSTRGVSSTSSGSTARRTVFTVAAQQEATASPTETLTATPSVVPSSSRRTPAVEQGAVSNSSARATATGKETFSTRKFETFIFNQLPSTKSPVWVNEGGNNKRATTTKPTTESKVQSERTTPIAATTSRSQTITKASERPSTTTTIAITDPKFVNGTIAIENSTAVSSPSTPRQKISFDIFHNNQPVNAVVVASRIVLNFNSTVTLPPASYLSVVSCQVEPINSPYASERDPIQIVKNGSTSFFELLCRCQADGVGLVCPPSRVDVGQKIEMEALRYTHTSEVLFTCLVRTCGYGQCIQPICKPVDGCLSSPASQTLLKFQQSIFNNPSFFGNRGFRSKRESELFSLQQQALLPLVPTFQIPGALQQNLQQQFNSGAFVADRDTLVNKKLVVVNTEAELQYFLRTGSVPTRNSNFNGFIYR